MKKENIICSAILGAAIIIGGLALRSGIVAFKDRDRQVSVKGLAEKEMKADKVTWPLIYKEIGNDPSELYSKLATKNASVVAFLKQGGITDKEISVNPPSVEDRQADSYGNDVLNYRYKATSVITVTSADIDKVRRLMTQQAELMKQGIPIVTEQYGDHAVRYDFISLNDIKPAMVEEATKNARTTAEKFAADSGSKIGKISHASQGQFTIEDRDATTPYIKNVRVVITMDYQLED